MLRNLFRAMHIVFIGILSALLLLVSASAADAAYLIHSHTDSTRAIFEVSNALDQGSMGSLFIQDNDQSYVIPVYRAGSGCTVTIQGSAAQLRVFAVDANGGTGTVRWQDELTPSIGQMRVTLAEGVQSIAASDFKSYSGRLTGSYMHEIGAGFQLTKEGYYLVNCLGNDLMPSSVIVQVTAASGSQGNGASTSAAQKVSATQNSAPVLINGKQVTFDAYTIYEGTYGYTYFKLRDLAAALSGTAKQYEVQWDKQTESILLVSGLPYTRTGGELETGTSGTKTATLSRSVIYKDGMPVSPTAYVIGQNNYFKLRDIAQLFDFSAEWDNDAMCIVIDTAKPYNP